MKQKECFGCPYRISTLDRFGGGCDLMDYNKICLYEESFEKFNKKICIICNNISDAQSDNPHCKCTENIKVNFVTGREYVDYMLCSEKNLKGDCADFNKIKI